MPRKKKVTKKEIPVEKDLTRCATCGKLLPTGYLESNGNRFCSPACSN